MLERLGSVFGTMATLCGLLVPAPATAQPCGVHFANGDIVQGQLVKMSGGVLEVETSWGGVLEIDFAQVQRLETSEPLTLELSSGERRSGRLMTTESGNLEIASGTERPLVVPFSEVVAINPPEPRPVYSGSVSAGANVQSGNSDQQTLTAAANLKRASEKNVFTLNLRWIDAEQSGVETARSTYGAFKYDRELNDTIYLYGSLEMLEDTFKDLDLRTVASVGVGYHWLTGDRRSLSVEGGASYFSRDYISIADDDEITVRLASYFEWKLGEGIVLRDDLVLFPSFDDSSLNLRHELILTTVLFEGWAAELASILDYNGDPPPGFEKEDWLWVLGLNYGF